MPFSRLGRVGFGFGGGFRGFRGVRCFLIVLPNLLDSISQIEVFGWGHALAVPFPGSHNGPAQLASARHGNIFFGASDNDAASSVENALANGFASGREVIQSLN